MKYHLVVLFVFLCAQQVAGQSKAYEDAYRAAMRDSVITEDEQALLTSLQKSLGLSEDQILSIEKRVKAADESGPALAQEGRGEVIAMSMAYGNGLYGWAIPYVLGVSNPRVYVGMQGLAAAGGFYYSWNETKTLDLPEARASFLAAGSGVGLTSTFPLISTVGWRRWFKADEQGKLALTYAMLSVPAGVYLGNRLYDKWQPSTGLADLTVSSLGYGGLNGFTLFSLLSKPPWEINNPEAYIRGVSLITYSSALLSSYYTYHLFKDEYVSTGDAAFYNLCGIAGLFTATRLGELFDISGYKEVLTLITLSVDGGLYAANRLNRDIDFTVGDVRIIGLGGAAGLALIRGIGFLTGINDSQAMSLLDLGATIGGGFTAYRYIAPDSRQSGSNQGSKLKIAPTFLTEREKLVPGVSLHAEW